MIPFALNVWPPSYVEPSTMSNFSSDRSVSSASLILSVLNVSVLLANPTFGSTVSSGLKPEVHESLAKCVDAFVGIHVE